MAQSLANSSARAVLARPEGNVDSPLVQTVRLPSAPPPPYPAPAAFATYLPSLPPAKSDESPIAQLCERRTFLDFALPLPEPSLMRARTAPDASTVCSTDDEDSGSMANVAVNDDQQSTSHRSGQESDKEESESEDESLGYVPPPPPLSLESFTTPDWYDPIFSDNVSNLAPGFFPLPALPEAETQWPTVPPPGYPAPPVMKGELSPSPPAEYPSANPAYLCVRRTFLDICTAPPVPELARAQTAPDTSSADSVNDGEDWSLFADGVLAEYASSAEEEEDLSSNQENMHEQLLIESDDAVLASSMCVKRTFLEITPALVEPQLARASTAPGASTVAPLKDEEMDAELSIESEDDELLLPPPPLKLESSATPDWYDNPNFVQGSSTGLPSSGVNLLPTLPEGQATSCMPVQSLQLSPCVPMPAPVNVPVVHSLPQIPTAAPLHIPPVCLPPMHMPMFQQIPQIPAPPPFYPAPIAPESEPEMLPPSGEADAEELSSEGAPTAAGLAKVCCENGKTRVFWALDARKLESQDKQAVSPQFSIDLPGEEGPQPFRLIVHPTARNDGRRGAGFKKSKGKGRIELKCETPRRNDAPDVVFRFAVGRDALRQPTRGVIASNFADSGCCCGLPKGNDEWNFSIAVDDHKTFLVILEVMPHGRTA